MPRPDRSRLLVEPKAAPTQFGDASCDSCGKQSITP
jgi:hypothetical protein